MRIPLLGIACICYFQIQAHDSLRFYQTKMIEGVPPEIDGVLDDAAWNSVEWAEGFVQREPTDGAPPSHQTKFKVLYDTKFLYFGIQSLDSNPEKVARRMSRRDGFEGDFVEVNIDSYHDKRTAFSFTASASGVKGDEYVSNNGNNWDPTWDPIWYLKTSLNKEGWVAEFKIPLSQLRFADKTEHTWGLQVLRHLFRNEERSFWQPIPRNASGWVHRFGELRGLRGIQPQKQLEIQPYLVGKMERSPAEKGNPYATGSFQNLSTGVDAKIGITSDITLDLTVNPDFGQVEADPSQVNLTAFQLFFKEQRPFFLEGSSILNFPLTSSVAGGSFNNDNLFYSRRVGAKPVYYPEGEDIAYVDKISNSKIIGAAKVTGKNKKGFSWGLLEALTNRSAVEVTDTLGERRHIAVAPRTNYVVGRVQQDINEGNALIGGMFTATNRFINTSHLNFLNKEAYSGGLDFTQYFADRNYYLSMSAAVSNIQGSTEALTRAQTSSVRYFQRPDNRHSRVDSTLRSLSGSSGSLSFGKQNGTLILQSGATFRSPGFELNDAGFLRQVDFISQWTWAQYRILKPFSIFRWIRINGNQYLNWDFDGVSTRREVNFNGHAQFKNLWQAGAEISASSEQISNADLRGGPSIRYPGSHYISAYLTTNDQKKLSVEVFPFVRRGYEHYVLSKGLSFHVRWQPIDALRISLLPGIDRTRDALQYINSYEHEGQSHYILGEIHQTTYSASLRVNYNLTPNLTLEFWGQPFISKGAYSRFKEVQASKAARFEQRYRELSPQQIYARAGAYHIDRNMDGVEDFSFDNPNFNTIEFKSNMVVRWEYIPGSTLFLVWAATSFQEDNSTQNSFRKLSSNLLNLEASNVFLIKYTYRFIL